jgi:hypothetical protein
MSQADVLAANGRSGQRYPVLAWEKAWCLAPEAIKPVISIFSDVTRWRPQDA